MHTKSQKSTPPKKVKQQHQKFESQHEYLNEFSDVCFRLTGTDDYFAITEWTAFCSISTCPLLQAT
jgi:hypothetical protein